MKKKKNISRSIIRNWVIAILFSLSIFIQLLISQWQLWHSLLWASLFHSPHTFWAFYLPKISIALLFGSLIFLFKKKSWSIIASFLIDIWIFAELIYYRANGVFLDFYSMTMVGNMKGFWGSVPMYIKTFDWSLVLVSTIYSVIVVILDKKQKDCVRVTSFYSFLAFFLIFLGINFWSTKEVATQCNSQKLSLAYFDPFSRKAHNILAFQGYEKNYSLIHGFVYTLKQAMGLSNKVENVQYSEKEEKYLASIYDNNQSIKPIPNSNLVILLIESLEDWAITEEIMPNLFKFCHSDSNIVYCPNIISQVRKGTSSDGQLIVETGLLPIDEGAVCFRFPQNTFPSLNDLYEGQKSTTLIPTPLSVWNQIKMSRCYKYDKDITCESNDKVALSLLSNLLGNYNSILAITVSTHSPFSSVSDSSSLDTHKGIPEIMSNYLRSLNYTDCFLGNFLDDYLENYQSNTTLVITGDHTVFYKAQRDDFYKSCLEYGLNYNVFRDNTSLIISSPIVEQSILINDKEYYQMDIYPTVLHLLGCSDYYWKGLGINLLNKTLWGGQMERIIPEEDAFTLSDKLIRNDFFNHKN